MRIFSFLFLAIVSVLSLSACLPEDKNGVRIGHYKLGDYDLYIPQAYLKFRHTSVGTESALLQTYYPGHFIVPEDSTIELWKKGLGWKSIRILVSKRNNKIPFDIVAKKSTRHMNATRFVSAEYDLQHYTQPEGANPDNYDIWFEKTDDGISSYITCSEKLTESSVPQCSHNFNLNEGLWLQISYDRRLLPEWRIIKTNIENMFMSFKTKDSSQKFLDKVLRDSQRQEKN